MSLMQLKSGLLGPVFPSVVLASAWVTNHEEWTAVSVSVSFPLPLGNLFSAHRELERRAPS